MGLTPNFRAASLKLQTCAKCGIDYPLDHFPATHSLFYPSGHLPLCNQCIEEMAAEYDERDELWDFVDKLCQYADIPFIPAQWTEIYEANPSGAFLRYAASFTQDEYDGIGWSEYYKAYKDLKDKGALDKEIPLLNAQEAEKLRQKWGGNYDDEALHYLETLYNGLMTTQNINGALQIDQALKVCKMSYEIDQRIRNGEEFDKLLSSYEKTVKIGEFTPKNVKNINDFDTCGELVKWLEKRGWVNAYYDNVPKDVVDETIANIQAFNQRLYTNESGIGDEITKRIEALKTSQQLEQDNYYLDQNETTDLGAYENTGYELLVKSEEFNPEDDE